MDLCSNASNGNGIVTVLGAFVDAQTYRNLFNFFKSLGKHWSVVINLFLKTRIFFPAEKSFLEELDWFSGEDFPSEIFPLENFLPEIVHRKFSAGQVSETFSSGKFSTGKSFQDFRLPAEISVTEIYRNSGSKNSGGKLETLVFRSIDPIVNNH